MIVDGQRMTPEHGQKAEGAWPEPDAGRGLRPFDGLRVLDLGVIVVGGEQGRLLADGGADVVKVESRAYPDGSRQSYLAHGLSVSFAAGHRNKRSLGLNLRDPAGLALFRELAGQADVVLSNFKPGTLASLGLDSQTLQEANPRLVLVDSSAFGSTGPWSGRMGYGPLVRATTGLAMAWRYPDDPEGFGDAVTIYPDHVSARMGALAAVALLIRRLRTGKGGTASLSQAEVMLSQFACHVAHAEPGDRLGQPEDWPRGVYRAAGDDDWCVVDVRGTADWERLATVLDFPGDRLLGTAAQRLAARDAIDKVLNSWMSARTAQQAMEQLQAAGVPAARMLRVADMPAFPYYRERGFFRVERHPYLEGDMLLERGAAIQTDGPDTAENPAPLAGEHSAQVIEDWLGRPDEIGRLIGAGVLEPTDEATLAAARTGGRRV